jgi:hypothetical protein
MNILHSKGLGGNIGDVDLEKKDIFNVFIKTLALQMKDCHSGNMLESCILLWFMFQQDFQLFFN